MSQTVLRHWWLLACRGALAIMFGMLAIMWPGITLLSLAALFAAFTLVGGAVWTFVAVRSRPEDERWWVLLLMGLVGVAAGAVAALHPAMTMLVLVLLVGAHALVTGAAELALALRLRRQLQGEWMLALAGAASIMFGMFVLLFPTGAGAVALAVLIGWYAIATGMLVIALAFRVRHWARSQPGGAVLSDAAVDGDVPQAPGASGT